MVKNLMKNVASHKLTTILVLLLCTVEIAVAEDIGVNNSSFELPTVTTVPGFLTSTAGPFCFANACPSIPGWELSGLGGVFQPNSSVFPPSAFGGSQVYFSDGRGNGDGIAVQELETTLYQPNLDYELTVSVGNRLEGFIPFGEGHVLLFSDDDSNNTVALLDLSSIDAPSTGQFTEVTLIATAQDVINAGALGQPIGIQMGGALTGQTIFDDVRLSTTVVPVPATLPLLGFTIAGFGLMRRRHRRN